MGLINKSNVWLPYPKAQPPTIPIEDLPHRAWEFRSKVIQGVITRGLDEHAAKVWEDTLKDVSAGFTVGPFFALDKVSEFVGTENWIATPRFPVVQKNKVRGVDGATSSGINKATAVTEKLELSSTDENVALIRQLLNTTGVEQVSGWVLDESKAYRQIGVHPDHRRYAVIVLLDPATSRPGFWVMIGHSFGWVSAVYNFNRRSRLLNEVLTREFKVLASCFYDDKVGFEPSDMVEGAFDTVKRAHADLGVMFDGEKLQVGQQLEILGVHYNLQELILQVKSKRKVELLDAIADFLDKNFMDAAQAAKFKGKLAFADSQFFGRAGRAFMLALSERQYQRSSQKDLTRPLRLALMQWREVLSSGKPRSLSPVRETDVEVAIFTDGYFPDFRKHETEPARIGGVIALLGQAPVFFSEVVSDETQQMWIERKTQIALVELLAAVMALAGFADLVRGKRTLLFVDAEAVEGALIKGYSGRSDICELVGLFWALIRDLDILMYIDRVPTDMNIADAPSRNRIQEVEALGWLRRNLSPASVVKQGLGMASVLKWTGGLVSTGVSPDDRSPG